MTNFFAGMLPIHSRFDLKGSTHSRNASEKEKAKGVLAILKDNDWLVGEQQIKFTDQESISKFLDVLTNDSEWLLTHQLIDYSLLVGVHSRTRARKELGGEHRERSEYMHVYTHDDGEDVLYVGIVDILQPYTVRKSCEAFCCGTLVCGRDISCKPPDQYASRFQSFMSSICTLSNHTVPPTAPQNSE